MVNKISKKLPLPKQPSTVSKPADKVDNLLDVRKKMAAGFAVALVGVSIIAAAALWPSGNGNKSSIKTSAVVEDVCVKKNTITFSCYKKLLSDITLKNGPEEAFSLIKKQYENVSYVKSQCHQLSHVIGREALNKYEELSDTFSHGDKFCWSGYYHGVMEQIADDKGYDYIIKNANSICAPIAAESRNSFYHYNCVHGLGHGFMMVQDGELFVSLKSCDFINDDWERVSCYGGVFMQNIMNAQGPDANPNQPPKFLRQDDPMYPCNTVEEKYKQQCYQMQTSYALQTVGYDFNKIFGLCGAVEELHRNTCYESIGRDASGSSNSDVNSTKTNCLLGPTQDAKRYCVFGAARDFVSYFHSDQQASQLCANLPADLAVECESTVRSYYSTF